METKEIMQAIANVHNDLCKMLVCADNAIILGDSLRALRALLDTLSQDSTRQEDDQN